MPAARSPTRLKLVQEGAEILDIGGESTRPGAAPVPETVELERVLPVIEGLRDAGCEAEISIDTSKAAVASAALAAGATLVNDVTALRGDPSMAAVVAGSGARCCLMHMLGEPRTMQRDPRYDEVVADVRFFLEARMDVRDRARDRRGSDPAGPGDRVRQDRRAQPGAVAAAATRSRSSADRS